MRVAALANELFPLCDPELVLLVNHHQTEVGQIKSLREQGMSPHQQRSAAACPRILDFGLWTLGRLMASGLHFHRNSQRLEPFPEIAEMLFGQNLRRSHQRHIVAALQGHQRAARRDHGLAGADVSLQQPPHWMQAGHVFAQLPQNLGLRFGQFETQLCEKRLHEAVVPAARQTSRFGFKILAPEEHLQLQCDKLVQRQSPPRRLFVPGFLREMEQPDRLGASQELGRRPRLDDL